MPELIAQLGVGGIFVMLVLQMVFKFLEKREGATPRVATIAIAITPDEWEKVRHQVDELHRLHDRMDADGVPVWYVRSSLEQTIRELVTTIREKKEMDVAHFNTLKAMSKKVDIVAVKVEAS